MLYDRVSNEKWEFPVLDQTRQQKSVFRPECNGVKQTSLDRHAGASNGETGGIQVSYATICLQQLILEGCEPQVFGFASQPGAISDKAKLKTVMLW